VGEMESVYKILIEIL